MGQQIQRLENDIKKFPKIEDPHDKFVEKMIISFWVLLLFFLVKYVNYVLLTMFKQYKTE